MAYTYINREIYPNMLVLDEPLDDNYAKGNSYDDYINGNPIPWIELGEEQLAFKEANPKATVKEIIEARLDESRILNEEKSAKYEELRSMRLKIPMSFSWMIKIFIFLNMTDVALWLMGL